jgi:hypothetical protein
MAKVQKSTDSSSLAEVVDRILDKGIVIDAFVKVSLVGIELLSIEARVVIASVETYLKYAEAIGLTASAAICVISAFWLLLNCVNAAATSGDIVDPPIVLPTGGTVVVANVCCVLVVLSSSSCVVLKIA